MTAIQEAQPAAKALTCETCAAENPEHARFCKACGGALTPPPQCPQCTVEVPSDARFCPGCGARLIGPRPVPDLPPAPAPAAAPAPGAATVTEADVAAAAAALPPSKTATSNVGSNVLLFVAILLVMVAVIYTMNKDAELEVSPFAGGPAPSAMGRAAPAAPAPATAAPATGGAPVTGVVRLADGVEAPTGTLFVILRNAGAQRGPPLAVKKVESPQFPYAFELGPNDIMIKGLPFTGPFDLQARLDRDGNAMTKDAGDLTTAEPISGVAAGAKVEIVLDKRL